MNSLIRTRTLPLAMIAVLALAAGAWLARTQTGADDEGPALAELQQQLKNAQALPADFRSVPEFNLIADSGAPLDASVLDNHWSLMFFGFTHCPDVCPITLSVLNEALKKIDQPDIPAPQVLFVSVDPARDTVEVMHQYVGYFNKDFTGVTGDRDAIQGLTSQLGIVAAFTENKDDPENYSVDHTASILLVDPQRRVRAKLNAPHAAGIIAADYMSLVGTLGAADDA